MTSDKAQNGKALRELVEKDLGEGAMFLLINSDAKLVMLIPHEQLHLTDEEYLDFIATHEDETERKPMSADRLIEMGFEIVPLAEVTKTQAERGDLIELWAAARRKRLGIDEPVISSEKH